MAAKKHTRSTLIELLAKELLRREPDNNMDNARYRVTHTSPGSVDTLRDLALNARVHDLITEEEYLRAAPEIHYGNREWGKLERRRENSRHTSHQRAVGVVDLPPGTKRG